MKNNPFLKVMNSTILCLQKYNNKDSLERQADAHGIVQDLKNLKLQELNLSESQQQTRGVGYRNILEKKGLRITIYYLPAGQKIKLHNHPSMLVVSYIVRGKLQAKVYSPTVTPCIFNKETLTLQTGCVSYIDGLRTNNKNLHEFKALEDTYFLDILFPDYDQKRECTFFEQEEQINEFNYKLKPIEPAQLQFYQI